MVYIKAFDHSIPAILLSAYGVLLLLWMFGLEIAGGRRPESVDHAKALEKLEPVPKEGIFTDSPPPSASEVYRLRRASKDQEVLRRMSANAGVFLYLASFIETDTSPEKRKLAQQVYRDSKRLRLCAQILRFVLPYTGRAYGIGNVLIFVDQFYWSTVRRLHTSYCLYHVRLSKAFTAACNLNVEQTTSSLNCEDVNA